VLRINLITKKIAQIKITLAFIFYKSFSFFE